MKNGSLTFSDTESLSYFFPGSTKGLSRSIVGFEYMITQPVSLTGSSKAMPYGYHVLVIKLVKDSLLFF